MGACIHKIKSVLESTQCGYIPTARLHTSSSSGGGAPWIWQRVASIAGKYSHAPRTGNPKTLCFSFESTDECSPTLAWADLYKQIYTLYTRKHWICFAKIISTFVWVSVGLFYFVLFSQIFVFCVCIVSLWSFHDITASLLLLPSVLCGSPEARKPDNPTILEVIVMRAARAARIGARAGRLSRVGAPQDVSMAEGRKEHGKVCQSRRWNLGKKPIWHAHLSTRYLNGHHLVSVRGSQWNRFQ